MGSPSQRGVDFGMAASSTVPGVLVRCTAQKRDVSPRSQALAFLIYPAERGTILVFQESCVGRILPAPFFLAETLSFDLNKRFDEPGFDG
jgi:hypothetical protein